MADDFPGQVQRHFGFLKTHGFQMTEATVADVFDNAYVTYRAPRLVIGVGRERGQCCFEVGANVTSLYDGHLLSELLQDAEGAAVAAQSRPSLSNLAATLRRQLPALEKAFSAESAKQTERALRRAGEERATKLFGRPAIDAPATERSLALASDPWQLAALGSMGARCRSTLGVRRRPTHLPQFECGRQLTRQRRSNTDDLTVQRNARRRSEVRS